MSIEIARFNPPVPVRDQEESVIKPLDAIDRGETVWEALPLGLHSLSDMVPVDNFGHNILLTVKPEGEGVLDFIPRGPKSVLHDTEHGAKIGGGTTVLLNRPDILAPITLTEVGRDRVPTGRDLVIALVRYVPGLPPPNH